MWNKGKEGDTTWVIGQALGTAVINVGKMLKAVVIKAGGVCREASTYRSWPQ